MSDLIDRKKAVQGVRELFSMGDCYCDELSIVGMLNGLRSAEPDQKKGRKFLGIVVNYPKICTYPEYEGKPYYSIKYEENGDMIVGFGTYKPEVLSQYLREYFISPAEPERKKGKWIKEDLSGYLTPGGNSIYHCSECGHTEGPWPHPRLTNFCPNCGAKMSRGE